MAKQVILLVTLAGVCGAVIVNSHEKPSWDERDSHAARWDLVHATPHHKQHLSYKHGAYAHPRYEYEYAVWDPRTGDRKRQREARDGDAVRGEYSLVEPDGSVRSVTYTADDRTGFNAIVSNSIHKHGDHAYSFHGHTRNFLPISISGGQKHNQLFPIPAERLHEEPKPRKLPPKFTLHPSIFYTPRVLNGMKISKNMKKVQATTSVPDNTMDNNPVTYMNKSEDNVMPTTAMITEKDLMDAQISMVSTTEKPSMETTTLPQITMQDVMAFLMANQDKLETKLGKNRETAASMQGDLMTHVKEVNEESVTEMPSIDKVKEEKKTTDSDSVAASSHFRSQIYSWRY